MERVLVEQQDRRQALFLVSIAGALSIGGGLLHISG